MGILKKMKNVSFVNIHVRHVLELGIYVLLVKSNIIGNW